MIKAETQVQTKDFYGAVILKELFQSPLDGRWHIGVVGRIHILKDEEMLGFRVHSSESNWCAWVVGRNGSTLTFPGCQIRGVMAITEKDKREASTDFLYL